MDHFPDRNCDLSSRKKRKKKKTRGEGNLRKRRGAFIYKRAFFINNNVGRNLWRDRPAATDDYVDDASRVDAFEIHRVFPFESINGMRWEPKEETGCSFPSWWKIDRGYVQFLTTDSWNFSAFLFFFFFLVNGNSRIGKFFMTREEISIDRFKEVDFSYRFVYQGRNLF